MANGKPTLHHLEDSQSQHALWLLEELGIEYELVVHKRVENRAPPSLRAAHPLGKAPTLVTPNGRVVTERSAIALWLIGAYDEGARFRLPPRESKGDGEGEDDVVREDQLLSLGAATLAPLLMVKLVLGLAVRQAPLPARPLVRAVRHGIDRAFLDAELAAVFGYLDSQLSCSSRDAAGAEGEGGAQKKDCEWFMGTPGPTRADFCLLWYVDWAMQWEWVDFDKYPRLRDFRARCTARPAWKRALEKGGGYNLKFWK
ncbi:hypothetical protein GGR52DRAFT_303606 [Hypoxylon sp. FL1284]|nr:hypothetical protein GGR52DRAFT_303606 [Hypoxylon sp. FL1284]